MRLFWPKVYLGVYGEFAKIESLDPTLFEAMVIGSEI